MSPYFDATTGELRDPDLYADVPDASAPPPAAAVDGGEENERHEVTPPTRPSAAPAPRVPAWTIPPTMTAVEARREFDRLREEWIADPRHVLGDERHREHEAALRYYSALGALSDGRDPAEGEEVLGELFANGQIRPLGTAAHSPAPRPVLPDGYEFDEAALVLAETEMHAMGARPSLVMEITDALAEIAEQAALRGVGWSEADAKAALVNRHGREGAQRVADNAQFAYLTLLESEHPLLVQRVRELGEEWGDDPRVITLFGTLVYGALCEAPMTDAKEALLSRRTARLRSAEEAGRAAAAKRQRAEEAEADEARAAFMTETAATHRRWGRVEP